MTLILTPYTRTPSTSRWPGVYAFGGSELSSAPLLPGDSISRLSLGGLVCLLPYSVFP